MSLALVIAVTVPVTREHLDNGRPGNCRRCALALAVTDAIEDATGAYVFYTSRDRDPEPAVQADVTLADGSVLSLALGPDVARIMARADRGQPVDPFTFTAEVRGTAGPDEITERQAAA